MKNPLIIALDFSTKQEVQTFLNKFEHERLFVKVGMELFYKEGTSILSFLKEQEHQIFLDLKLHDIPNTVRQGMRSLASYGVDLVNVHALGGTQMMQAAIEGLDAGTPSGIKRPQCIAVTQLTSTSDAMLHNEQLVLQPMDNVVVHYASLAKKSGLDGVVCSTLEVPRIRTKLGDTFLTVTPGIRLETDSVDDQMRVATPIVAKENGSSAIVVGRSITRATNPLKVYKKMLAQWNEESVTS
ncbi:orotidine-5'-phosphate decarboxylase [Bacillus sp. CGMCC 1.16541]|uniref:orotidine-5'-phosphate decarboxylase n=1 Tax=Bacillus sp. CGMCC 1.16541 TaxID=2185143 RepID=UPI000D7331A1|nr:orotidine-5'-phosphate decarboxylase [Bacillus sp. CGMCC 1.16541]